uniref:Uncharacterized protein n=1 Tax=Daphnia magna TaxID=35525 RepID=A0A0P5XAQ6_9CRUS
MYVYIFQSISHLFRLSICLHFPFSRAYSRQSQCVRFLPLRSYTSSLFRSPAIAIYLGVPFHLLDRDTRVTDVV